MSNAVQKAIASHRGPILVGMVVKADVIYVRAYQKYLVADCACGLITDANVQTEVCGDTLYLHRR